MKIFKTSISLLLCLSFMVFTGTVRSQTRIDFNGMWKTQEDVLVHIEDSGSAILVKYLNLIPGDCASGHDCVLGGGSGYYLKGSVNSKNQMDLTMLRRTHEEDMRDGGLSAHWPAPCKVTAVTNKSISGTFRMEWYQNDYKDGKRVNFRRDVSRDFDSPFNLTRTNCKDELERLVAEVDRKAEAIKEQEAGIEDVRKNFHMAIQEWENEAKDHIQEELYQEIVHPIGKISIDQEPDVESWLDFINKKIAKDGGHFARVTNIGLFFDFLIDWANINAKGVVTVQEVGQMNDALMDMSDRRGKDHTDWVNAKLEYEKLRELCAGEIPLDKQPKPKVSSPFDPTEFERLHDEANRTLGSIQTGLQSTKIEITKTVAAIEELKTLLEPHRNADPKKTMGEVMTGAEIQKLQKGYIEAGNAWGRVFKELKKIQDNLKLFRALTKPGLG